MRRRLIKGFSLSEVLICIAVVAIAFLGTFASLISSQRAVSIGQRMTVATGYCRQICEIIRARGLAYINGFPAPGTTMNTTPGDTTTAINNGAEFASLPNDTNFTRSITTEKMGSTGYNANLYRVTVVVYWREGRRLNNVSMVTLSRVPLT